MVLIDGKKTSETIQSEIAEEVILIKNNGGKVPHLAAVLVGNDGGSETYVAAKVKAMVAAGKKQPHLAAVLVGNDGGSETYVAAKIKACERVGFKSTLIRFDENVTEEELLNCVEKLNNDADLDGFIVQ